MDPKWTTVQTWQQQQLCAVVLFQLNWEGITLTQSVAVEWWQKGDHLGAPSARFSLHKGRASGGGGGVVGLVLFVDAKNISIRTNMHNDSHFTNVCAIERKFLTPQKFPFCFVLLFQFDLPAAAVARSRVPLLQLLVWCCLKKKGRVFNVWLHFAPTMCCAWQWWEKSINSFEIGTPQKSAAWERQKNTWSLQVLEALFSGLIEIWTNYTLPITCMLVVLAHGWLIIFQFQFQVPRREEAAWNDLNWSKLALSHLACYLSVCSMRIT